MLLQFSVENYKSFKDRTVLSLEGSVDKELANNYVLLGKEKVLKVILKKIKKMDLEFIVVKTI